MRIAKKVWETHHLKELKAQEEKILLDGEEEELLTYTREDAYNKVTYLSSSLIPPQFLMGAVLNTELVSFSPL